MKISVLVSPHSKKEGIEILPDGVLKVRVKEPPVDGKANEAVLYLLAKHFGVPASSVRLVAGGSGRRKIVEILK